MAQEETQTLDDDEEPEKCMEESNKFPLKKVKVEGMS